MSTASSFLLQQTMKIMHSADLSNIYATFVKIANKYVHQSREIIIKSGKYYILNFFFVSMHFSGVYLEGKGQVMFLSVLSYKSYWGTRAGVPQSGSRYPCILPPPPPPQGDRRKSHRRVKVSGSPASNRANFLSIGTTKNTFLLHYSIRIE